MHRPTSGITCRSTGCSWVSLTADCVHDSAAFFSNPALDKHDGLHHAARRRREQSGCDELGRQCMGADDESSQSRSTHLVRIPPMYLLA